MRSQISPRKVLILAANPSDQGRLRLDKEEREIREGLQAAKYRERFQLERRGAVRPQDLQQALLDVQPNIVHFCGHGVGARTAKSKRTDAVNRDLKAPTESSLPGLASPTSGGLVLEDDND